MKKIFILLFIFSSLLLSDKAHDIINKLDENMRGKNIYIMMSMKVVSMGHQREMKIESYSQGN